MLKIDTFRAGDDCVVIQNFDSYRKGDIVPANTIEKTKLVSLWLKGKVRNVGYKKYTEVELDQLGFQELRDIGKSFGVKDRSKDKLKQEILAAQ